MLGLGGVGLLFGFRLLGVVVAFLCEAFGFGVRRSSLLLLSESDVGIFVRRVGLMLLN